MTVPINTIISAIFLFNMFGAVVVVCYIAMALLLVLQYFSNKKLATLQLRHLKLGDKRIEFLTQILKGIKTIKVRALEKGLDRPDNKSSRSLLSIVILKTHALLFISIPVSS